MILLPYFTQSGADRQERGGQYIANLRDGAWCGFRYFSFDGSEKAITASVRGRAAGYLEVRYDLRLPPAASLPVRPAEDWTEVRGKTALPEGTRPLYFTFRGSGSLDFQSFEIG